MAQQQTPKRETVIATLYKDGVLTLSFPRIQKQLVVQLAELDPVILEHATAHGLKQKLADAAAISRNPETGKPATDADKYLAVLEVYNRITKPEGAMWNAIREGGDGSASLLVRALARYHDGRKTRPELEEWLKTKSDAERKALSVNPKIVAIIAQIKAESADVAGIDSDELLDEAGE